MEKLSIKYEVMSVCIRTFENQAESYRELCEDYKKREMDDIADGGNGTYYKAQWQEYEAKYNVAMSILSDLAKKL